ncbi:MAG TPA: 5-(carboxyamino)imidazole ribonucleotide synthase [Streptosporangiaceae bacterium]|nr:5-(carboxyamino)imidazole ribonucleotide synthase [Streptosporangiaceae bacterium]
MSGEHPRIGILGAGQLGLMLAQAARDLDIGCRFYAESDDVPGASMGTVIRGSLDDEAGLARFASGLDAVTYEWENVPVAAVRRVAEITPVRPASAALEVSQDRLAEKTFFTQLGEQTARFAPVGSREALDKAVADLGFPSILKTRRLGYDGRGQAVLRQPADLGVAWQALGVAGSNSVPLILEERVNFDRELSVIGIRGEDGSIACYPPVENHHRDGILRVSTAPAPGIAAQTTAAAIRCATRTLTALGYVGVLAIELFDVGGQLLVNEMAPRVHNSGHLTIEGAVTSQFENHVRAVLGLPLGDTRIRGAASMVNLIGDLPPVSEVLAIPGAHLHLYGKSPRPGRKLGHVTVCADTQAQAAELRRQVESVMTRSR